MSISTVATEPKPSSPFASWRGDHAGLRVSDLEAAVAWYVETLDFRLMSTMPYGDLTFAFVAPATDDSFRLELLGGPGAGPRPTYGDLGGSLHLLGWHHVCIRVESVDAAVAALRHRKVEIVAEPVDVPPIGRRIAFFADPWKNLFELTQPIVV